MQDKAMVEYALELAEQGFKVFPVRGKIPIVRWTEQATTRAKDIEALWEEYPTANIGIPCGRHGYFDDKEMGLVALDFDDPECEAAKWLAPKLPDTLSVKTGRGVHRYFKTKASPSLKNLQLDGVDLRTDGGLVVGPGSIHKNGSRYEWVPPTNNPMLHVAELPEEVVEYLLNAKKTKRAEYVTRTSNGEKIGEGQRHGFLLQETWKLACRMGLTYEQLVAVTKETLVPQCENPEDISDYEIEEICRGAIAKRQRFAVPLNKLTEVGLADMFIEYYGDTVVAIDGETWYGFNQESGLWERIPGPFNLTIPVRDAIYSAVINSAPDNNDVVTKVAGWYKMSGGFNYLNNVTKFVAPRIEVGEADFLVPDGTMPYENGLLNMRTGEFRDFVASDFVRHTVNAEYEPEAQCPRWLETITYLTKGDTDCIRYLQQIFGLLVSTDTIRGVFYFVGVPNSGKNTLVCALNDILGKAFAGTASKALIHYSKNDDDEQQARRHLALVGKRFVWIDETREDDVVDAQKFKSIGSTNTWLRARKLRHDAFDFINKAKVVIMSNYPPRIDPDDEAAWSRVVYVPFLAKIPDNVRRPDFMEEIKEEGAGVLAWCQEGYRMYLENGQKFDVPPLVDQQIKLWQEDSTPLLEFVRTSCDLGEEYECTAAMLYSAYEQWRKVRCLGDIGDFSGAPTLMKSLRRLLGDALGDRRTKSERFVTGIVPREYIVIPER